jgi:predicted TPR repeat methyltransferase
MRFVGKYSMSDEQKKNYMGIDLSHEAIKIAKKRREMLSFMQADASTFVPPPGQTYDMIVFNEMLYYMNHKEIIEKYSTPAYLSVGGMIVISVWYSKKFEVLKTSIFKDRRSFWSYRDRGCSKVGSFSH